jgi:hypothetical protein
VAVAFVVILVFLAYPKRLHQHLLLELHLSTSFPQLVLLQLELQELLDQPSYLISYL